MDINVSLLAEPSLAAKIVELSRKLTPLGNTLVLDALHGPFPHVTLYLTGFEDDSISMIPPLLEGNLRGFPKPDIIVSGVTVSAQGSVLLNVEKTRVLDTLHRWMLHKLNSFRMRAKPEFWNARREQLGAPELARLDQLGYPYVHDAWSPHFTIGKIDRARNDEAKTLLGDVRLQGEADCIGIGSVGAHGSIPAILGKAHYPEI